MALWNCMRTCLLLVIAVAIEVAYAFHAVSQPRRLPAVVVQRQRTDRMKKPCRRPWSVIFGSSNDEPDEWADDESILNAVDLDQLVDLCDKCGISNVGTKPELLQRLRNHAEAKAENERQRILARATKVQEGTDDSKERYELLSDEPDEGATDDDGFFYFELPTSPNDAGALANGANNAAKEAPRMTRESITAPPPPMEQNASGERVVTTYSTSETNDLTAISASQPGRGFSPLDALGANAATTDSLATQPWDMQKQQHTSEASTQQVEQAREQVTELVATLLATTGAPGFASPDDDDEPDINGHDGNAIYNGMRQNKKESSMTFVGFNPAKVPSDLLTASSRSLRTNRGQVLADVLRQFELQAIGYDGMAGDNTARGGGHYREVSKVRAFLEGFRRAEVRRLARETTTLLLDKLMLEGVEGLDITLSTMVRTSDDTEDYAGALNDSLLDFLNDSIRQQEKKVGEMIGTTTQQTTAGAMDVLEESDPVENLWSVSMENGQRVETLDPNDPAVRRVLQAEASKTASFLQSTTTPIIPDTAAEKMLLLLKLLRDRVKAEAAFGADEKGRNLRLLAYCLQLATGAERKQLMLRDVGGSLDRLDSFIELVTSSIEYGTSTSYELQPAKKQTLNVYELEAILEIATSLRRKGEVNSKRTLQL